MRSKKAVVVGYLILGPLCILAVALINIVTFDIANSIEPIATIPIEQYFPALYELDQLVTPTYNLPQTVLLSVRIMFWLWWIFGGVLATVLYYSELEIGQDLEKDARHAIGAAFFILAAGPTLFILIAIGWDENLIRNPGSDSHES